MAGRTSRTTCALALAVVIVASSATVALGGLGGKYSGEIKRGGPTERKIVLRVKHKRAKLVELPLHIDCTSVTGETIDDVVSGGSGKIKKGFSHKFFNIKKRVDDFHGGTLKVHIGVDFHGKKMVGIFDATLDYGIGVGGCSDGGNFRARK
jgi:hypothetical protein